MSVFAFTTAALGDDKADEAKQKAEATAKAAADAKAKADAQAVEKTKFLAGLASLKDFEEITLDGMTFIKIPAGTFLMGTTPEQIQQLKKAGQWNALYASETPAHAVTLTRPFLLGKTEITQGQWKRVFGDKSGKKGDAPRVKFAFAGDDLPAESVSYDAAQQFIGRLNATWGGKFRLPSEADWEISARAGGSGLYGNGEKNAPVTAETLPEYAWFAGNSDNKTHPAGSRKPNAWGLHDMLGNVWEWCQDSYGPRYYAQSPKADPLRRSPEDTERVFRGGSWFLGAENLRVAFRGGQLPDFRSAYVGFRVARDL